MSSTSSLIIDKIFECRLFVNMHKISKLKNVMCDDYTQSIASNVLTFYIKRKYVVAKKSKDSKHQK